MAEIDSSIYFKQQGADITGSIDKGLALSDLLQKKQDENASRQVMKEAVTKNQDGSLSFDYAKGISGFLAAGQADKAIALQNQKKQQDLAALAQQEAMQKKALNDARYTTQVLNMDNFKGKSPEQVQQLWQANKIQAIKDGHPEAAQLPDQYDPNLHQQLLSHAQSLIPKEEILKEKLTQSEIDKNNYDITTGRELKNENKTNQEVDKTIAQLEQMRGNPAAQQAEKDFYAAQKFNRGFNLKGDPNNLNPQVVKLLLSEAGKIATGGVPTVAELQGLSQNTIPSALAKAAQALTNESSPAKQGAFLREIKAYNDGLLEDAKNEITGRYGRILDVAEADQKIKNNPRIIQARKTYMGRFDENKTDKKDTYDWEHK